ncbi:MAG: SUMF1/EgtB/PvdO family nonheme iron enzyme [Candidatus Sericytochromatia bacterium]
MKKKFFKTTLSLVIALSMFSCNSEVSKINTIEKDTFSQKEKGILKINLKEIFNSKSFSIKKYDFNDSLVFKTRIAVYDAGSNTPEVEKIIKKSEGLSEYSLSVSTGNKFIILENLDEKDVVLSRLMSTITITGGSTTTLKMNYGTIPAAKVLKRLIETNVNIAKAIDLSKLQELMNSLTGYDALTNTYGGVNPSYVDVEAVVAAITNNFTNNIQPLVPLYTRGKFDTEVKGKLKIRVAVSRTTVATQTLAGGTSIKLNSIDNISSGQSLLINNQIIKINTIDGTNKTITFTPALTANANVGNNVDLLLTGARLTINDLTATNVSSTSDPTTIIENVSQGTSLLRATASDLGKNIYIEQNVTIASNNLEQIITLMPTAIVPQSVVLEQIENNDNLLIPQNGVTFTLLEGQSANLKAKVIMTDKTYNQNYTVTSGDTNIASSSGNSISGIKAGTTSIKIAATDDLTKFITINVKVVASNPNNNTGSLPTISDFSPNSTSTGTVLIINGYNFDEASNNVNTVTFNGINGTTVTTNPYEVTKTQLKVIVPNNATTGRISVTTPVGTVISTNYLIVSSPANTTGMVYIKGDEFYMGMNSSDTDDFHPRHKILLSDFYIDKTEVTNLQFKDFIIAGGYTAAGDAFWSAEGLSWRNSNNITKPSYWDDTRFNQDEQPVVGISYYEAEAYANFKNRRLPTEAEWEFAARGKDERYFPWGGDSPSGGNKKANGYFGDFGKEDGFQYTAKVGSFNSDESAYGLKDMSGNAAEWTKDWYDARYYTNSETSNPKGPSIGGTKVIRGGSWYNHPFYKNDYNKLLDSLKTYTRFYSSPTNRSNYIGFRTAK